MNPGKSKIDLSAAEFGMVLAEAIGDQYGRVILPAGAKLTEGEIEALRLRGIAQIQVEDRQLTEADMVARQLVTSMRLAVLFRKSSKDGAIESLRKSVAQYHAEQFT